MDERRHPRGDFPGAFHHVTNRGLASRPAFEGRADVRAFLALLAWQVHEGRIEVHAFSILTTHFHLLLRSLRGELSDALMRVEYRYVKRFNRLHDRDGPLFHSRFRSRLVDSDEYWFNVIRYIDANAVDAGLCTRPAEYEFGSARMYVGGRSAPWLERGEVEQTVMRASRSRKFAARDYEWVFGLPLPPEERWVLERRIDRGGPNDGGCASGDELLRAAPEHVLRWLQSRAEIADGGKVGLALISPARLQCLIRNESRREPEWNLRRGRKRMLGWKTLEVGLLRQLCGLTLQEIASSTGISRSSAWNHCELHSELLASDRSYRRRVEGLWRALGVPRGPPNDGKP